MDATLFSHSCCSAPTLLPAVAHLLRSAPTTPSLLSSPLSFSLLSDELCRSHGSTRHETIASCSSHHATAWSTRTCCCTPLQVSRNTPKAARQYLMAASGCLQSRDAAALATLLLASDAHSLLLVPLVTGSCRGSHARPLLPRPVCRAHRFPLSPRSISVRCRRML